MFKRQPTSVKYSYKTSAPFVDFQDGKMKRSTTLFDFSFEKKKKYSAESETEQSNESGSVEGLPARPDIACNLPTAATTVSVVEVENVMAANESEDSDAVSDSDDQSGPTQSTSGEKPPPKKKKKIEFQEEWKKTWPWVD